MHALTQLAADNSSNKHTHTRAVTHTHAHRLQFRGEVDPGSEDFWNRVTLKKYKKEYKEVALEIREERTLFTVEQANAILEKLFRAGERC
jgi:hypothetical protein